MASVTNLDNDVNSKRGDRVTPDAVNEVRQFIEESLGEPLPDVGDDPKFGTYNILAALKDGVALCKYVLSTFSKIEVWLTRIAGSQLSSTPRRCAASNQKQRCHLFNERTSLYS